MVAFHTTRRAGELMAGLLSISLVACVAATSDVDYNARIVQLEAKADVDTTLDLGQVDVFHVPCPAEQCTMQLSLTGVVEAADDRELTLIIGHETDVLRYREALMSDPAAEPPIGLLATPIPVGDVNAGYATLTIEIDEIHDFGLVHASGAPGTVQPSLAALP